MVSRIFILEINFKQNNLQHIKNKFLNLIQVVRMEEYIVVVEVPKIKIPYTSTLRIRDQNNFFYLYPHKFLSTLHYCNKHISKILNDNNYEQHEFLGEESFITKQTTSSTFIVTKIKLKSELESDNTLDITKEHFNPLLSIFSLFLTEIFQLNVIYIFQKRNNIYHFIHMIEIPNYNKEISKEAELRNFLYLDEVENHFSWVLVRLLRRKKYLEYVDEFLTGKLKSYHLGIQLLNYWNTLEHIANNYWNERGKNKILETEAVRKINKIITDNLKDVSDDKLIFPGLSLDEILNKNLLLCNNHPPIRDKITKMCEKNFIKLNEEEKDIIKMIYHLRNQLDHSDYYLTSIIQGFLERFKLRQFLLKDIIYIVIKFSLIVQKVLLKLLKIIPNYYILDVKNEYYHKLKPKIMNLSSNVEEEKERKARLDERFDMNGLSKKEISLKHLRYDKLELLNRAKYMPLIKFISRLKKNYYNLTYNNSFTGRIISKDFELPVKMKFEDDLNFSFETSTKEKIFFKKVSKEDLIFKIDDLEKVENFGVEFKPIIKEFSQTSFSIKPNDREVKGNGFSLRRDIKR